MLVCRAYAKARSASSRSFKSCRVQPGGLTGRPRLCRSHARYNVVVFTPRRLAARADRLGALGLARRLGIRVVVEEACVVVAAGGLVLPVSRAHGRARGSG